jgi:hypothetical protein
MKSQTESRLSGLLTAEENAAVLNMIGARAQPLATTVAQVPFINPRLSCVSVTSTPSHGNIIEYVMLSRIPSCRLNVVPDSNANLKAKLLTSISFLAFLDFKNYLYLDLGTTVRPHKCGLL